MKLVFGGVRGSQPVCGSGFSTFGGDTTSLLLMGAAGERVIIDAGTGIANLESHLSDLRDLLILFSHYHLDHMVGLPAFVPLYDKEVSVTMIGSVQGGGVETAVRGLLGPPYWPVPANQMGAQMTFVDFTGSDVCGEDDDSRKPYSHGGLQIRAFPVHHPGGCLAWRIDEPATGQAIVFATDIEWALMPSPRQQAFADFCRRPEPVAVLIMDGNYTAEDYAGHTGWGHSAVEDVKQLGREVDAGRILITHHGPENDDDELTRREAALNVGQAGGPVAELARQGLILTPGTDT